LRKKDSIPVIISKIENENQETLFWT